MARVSGEQNQSPKAAEQSKTIIFLGDSLTEGYGVSSEASYPSLVAAALQERGYDQLKIINAGVSGATTAGAIRRLQWHLRSQDKPIILVLALGANDGLRGLDLAASQQNLEEVISTAQEQKIDVVLAGMKIPPNYGEQYAAEFEALFPELAKKYDLTLIPFLLDGVAAERHLNLPDGIHPNELGYEIVAENVLNHLLPTIDRYYDHSKTD